MPSWFDLPNQGNRDGLPRNWLLSPGFSGNFMLLTWSVMGGLLVLFALSLWREKLLEPMYEESIDTTEQILEKGLIPFHHYLSRWGEHLRKSDDPVYQKLGEITISPVDASETYDFTVKMQDNGTLVYIHNAVSSSPNFPQTKLGDYHYSKDILLGASPYKGWIVNKLWPLNEKVARHILKYQQVCPD